jgi:putative protease
MSPAGYWPQLNAAVDAGADSVYFGLKHFTARAKVGFSLDELPDVMQTLHRRGVKGFVTFNTLVFEHEIDHAASTLADIARAGADAIIVQDLGAARLAHQIAPDLEIHGSTQMSITSAEGIALAQQFGATRVVLARELSLDDIRTIRRQTDCEIEIFVHGALCVSYSGQCFSSEAWGGRSANRGQCAQACRLPYEMVVDGWHQPLDEARYLLSPGDLYALHQVPEIVSIGVDSLKIEGRYKDVDYVALTTAAYRKAIDEACAGRALSISPREELQLEQVYSRGMGPYFISGTDHQEVVNGRAPRHRGVMMGSITRVLRDAVIVATGEPHRLAPLKPGDGVVFDAAGWRSPEQKEEGGRIYEVATRPDGNVELRFANNAIDFTRIREGDLLWRTDDPDLAQAIKAIPVHRQMVNVRATAVEGAPLVTEWSVAEHRVVIQSPQPLSRAQNRALNQEQLRSQFDRLGNTPYELGDLQLAVTGAPFAPSSVLNAIRREAVEQLQQLQAQPHRVTIKPIPERAPAAPAVRCADPQIHLLVRTPDQLDAAIELRPASITLDYLELYGLKPSVDRVRASGVGVRVASPRVLKPSEERIVHFLLKLECPIVVRSSGLLFGLSQREHPELIGDFSLNAANTLTAEALLGMGLTRLTPTHDLNADQIVQMAKNAGGERVEVIAYHHLPVFHMEHCVFCRFLSEGSSYKDCGHPCEQHRVSLRDPSGREHPIMADVGCRNTVFGAEAQEASAYLESWLNAGIRHYRLEFVHESPEQVTQIGKLFADAFAGRIGHEELTRRLRRIAPQGTTEGSFFIPSNYPVLPVLQ